MLKRSLKRLLGFSLAFCLLTSQATFAADIDSTSTASVKVGNAGVLKSTDKILSEKDSILKFIQQNPECREKVIQILREKGALNPDNSIKDDLGRFGPTL